MRRLLLGLSMAILVMAKPELYREKEDFQYSRSSSDEGSKSGYYDAQRGNMGGNYERAHNMDGLAQHQMGGLVKQVEGELGDGSKTRTGSVFTAASSQGIYGSGRYDLSNLAGRNFQEGVSYHDSQSHLSAANRAHSSQYSALNSGRYNTDSLSHSSGNGGFHQADNLQEAQNAYGAREYEHGSHSQHSSKYYVRSGYQGNSDYEQSNLNQQASNNFGADSQARLVSQVPVRIVVRPGTRVAIPIATQAHSRSHATSYDQSNFNSEAEVLNTGDQQTAFRPSGDAKNYESSYSYRKEWEKHNTKPLAVPLATSVVPAAKNSELYDESRLHDRYTQNADYNLGSSHLLQQAGFNSQHSALSSESQHEANYNARQHTASSNVNSNAFSHSGYNALANSNSDDLSGVITSKPKSYHSSYSYHKSWERQGDPYVIVPPSNGAYNGQTSQRLTDFSGSQGEYSSHNFGSRKSHQAYTVKDCVIECDPNSHIRVARSYNSKPAHFEEQNQNTQQSQNLWDNLGQQTQNTWGQQTQDAGQQVQNKLENLEDLGQQTQNLWVDETQDAGQQIQNKWDNLADLGQQTQNSWGQQTQDAGQQVQNKLENLEDLGQQTQNLWGDETQDAGQQIQNEWENLGQQTQDGGQVTENKWDLGQQTQSLSEEKTGQGDVNGWNNLESFGQQSEQGQDQQTQDIWDTQKPTEVEDLGQHTQTEWDQSDKHEQQVSFDDTQQTEHDRLDKPQTFNSQDALGWWPNQHNTEEQTSQNVDSNQQMQGFDQSFDKQNVFEQTIHHDKSQETFIPEDLNQQTQGLWNLFSFDHDSNRNTESNKPNSHEPQNSGSLNSLWGKLDNLDGDYVSRLSTSQTQNTDYSQASSFDSLWGKDDLDDIPSSVTTPETHNVDLSQSSNSHDIWNQESLISVEDLKTSTTEKLLKVTDIPADEKHITTTKKSQEGKIRPSDFGRGDIGPEDVIIDVSTTTQKTSSQYDTPSNKYTTERIDNKEHKKKNEKHKPDETQSSDIQTEQKHEPTRNIFDQENEQIIPLNFPETLNKDDMQHQNKPSHNPESHVVNFKVPEEIEQQFETQNVQEHEHKFDYFEQKPVQHEIGQEQNSEFGIFDQKMPGTWEQYPNHPDVADQQFVDFSQTNQQWHMEQQNIQQQFSDVFYQQNQNSPSQNRNADVFDQENEESLPDFGQQNVKSEFEVLPTTEQQILRKDYVENFGQQANKKLEKEEIAPPEPVTEKTGFWKSVGNKFASAKDKVVSWFSS